MTLLGGPASDSFVLIFAVFLISLWFGSMVHEVGHFLCACLVKIPVVSFTVGRGPILFKRQVRITSFKIHLLPFGGAVRLLWPLLPKKHAQIFVMLGGVFGNALMIAIFGFLGSRGLMKHLPTNFGSAILFGQIIPVLNLIPYPAKVGGKSVGTDGLQALRILFRRQRVMSPAATTYLEIIKRYVPEADASILKSSNASRILLLLVQADISKEDDAGLRIDEEFLHMIDSGTLFKAEEVLVLDALVTSALLRQNPTLVGRIDEWSLRSLELAPMCRPLLATRGGVLAKLGRYSEAKAILEPIVRDATDLNEEMISRLFLAYAERGLGDERATFRCLWELRRGLSKINLSRSFWERLKEIETEVTELWPLQEAEDRQISLAQ